MSVVMPWVPFARCPNCGVDQPLNGAAMRPPTPIELTAAPVEFFCSGCSRKVSVPAASMHWRKTAQG
jgi:hypothetical protein